MSSQAASSNPNPNPKSNNESQETNVRVVVRCRPLSQQEKKDPNQYMCLRVEPSNAVIVNLPQNPTQRNQTGNQHHIFYYLWNLNFRK